MELGQRHMVSMVMLKPMMMLKPIITERYRGEMLVSNSHVFMEIMCSLGLMEPKHLAEGAL